MVKQCICGKEFKTWLSRLKEGRGLYCSDKCFRENYHRRSGLIYNIKVKNKAWFKKGVVWRQNRNFKTGITRYRQQALRLGFGKKCENCGSVKNIYIHHIDRNRKNNKISNWMSVCAKCHCSLFHPRRFYGNQYVKK